MRRRARPACLVGPFALALSLVATESTAQTLFADVEDAFPDQGCRDGAPEEVGCWTNYLRLTDIDGDGDLDVIFPNASGFFSDPGAQPLEIYLNDGEGSFEPGTVELLGEAVEGAYRVVAIGDIDGDGRRDIFLPSASGDADRLFVQDENGDFHDQAAARIDSHSESAAARFGDIDGDGDLDLFVAQGYASPDSPPARIYYNNGAGRFTELQGGGFIQLVGRDVDDIDFVDVDGDSDLDVLLNTHEGKSSLWLNDGTGVFEDFTGRLPPMDDGSAYHYGPAACDIDGDGDRDLLLDNVGPDYGEQVLVNDGTGHFTAESDRIEDDGGDDDNGIVCLDFDDDGDLDIVVVSLSSNGERLFENDGTGHFTRVAGAFTALRDPSLWMEAGDVNGDGRLDVVTAQGEGDVQLERLYLGADGVAVDASGPRIFAIDVTSFWPEVRFAVQDNATSDEGPRVASVDARLAGADAPLPATFMGGDLYRVVLPEDATDFDLCATDVVGNLGCVDVSPSGGGVGGFAGEGGYHPSVTVGVGGAASSDDVATAADTAGSGDADPSFQATGGCAIAGGRKPAPVPAMAAALGALALLARRVRS